jgi:PKHD-type hydroxylase
MRDDLEDLSNECFPLRTTNYDTFVYYENVFSKEECDQIIKQCLKDSLDEAPVGGDTVSPHFDLKIRNSSIKFSKVTPDNVWIFQRLYEVLSDCNQKWYQYDLSSFGEGFQFTKYTEGQFYDWHQDLIGNRKLSIVVQLSSPEDYQGGDLEFFTLKEKKVCNSLGSVILFPSFEVHRVTKLERGTRHSLVVWVWGPAFR